MKKYKRPQKFYNNNISSKKLIGAFIDVQTNKLVSSNQSIDKLIKLSIVKFEYSFDGKIYCVLDELLQYQDPQETLPASLTKELGISTSQLKNEYFNIDEIIKFLDDINLIITYNAEYKKSLLQYNFPILAKTESIEDTKWLCLRNDVEWYNEQVGLLNFEHIAYKHGCVFDANKLNNNCLAGIYILAQRHLNSEKYILSCLLQSSRTMTKDVSNAT